MGENKVLSTIDLQAHLKELPATAHGIVPLLAPLISAGKITLLDTPTDLNAAFTWDDAWHDADLTAYTSATARWAILSVYGYQNNTYPNNTGFEFGKYGGTTAYITATSPMQSTQVWNYGSVLWVPMDGSQRFSYHFPSNFTTKAIYLLGYVG